MAKIFVFGSNLQGKHGKGAALYALKNHGAIYWQGSGLQGNSYAIPTKITPYQTMPLVGIKEHVDVFLDFAEVHSEHEYEMTRIGCGLAGYKDGQIAPMFQMFDNNGVRKPLPAQIILPAEWLARCPECLAPTTDCVCFVTDWCFGCERKPEDCKCITSQ